MLTKFASRTAAALVAAVAGIISYSHIREVALRVGEGDLAGMLLPLGIDGLIVVAAMAMIEDKRAGRYPRPSARVALVLGIVMTVAGNVASAEASWVARAVAAVPALSFLVAVEVLARTGRLRAGQPSDQGSPTSENAVRATERPQNRPAHTSTPAKQRKRSTADRVATAAARTPAATPAELAARLKVSERTVQRYLPAPAETVSPNGGAH